MKRRQRLPAGRPTPEFDWLDAATMARQQRDQSFKQTVERVHQRREAWTSKDIARHFARGEKPLRD